MVVPSRGEGGPGPTRLERRIARAAFALLLLGLGALALWLPFRDAGTLLGFVRGRGSYQASCGERAAAYLADVRERRYLPQRLRIRRWESPSHQPGAVVGETLFASMLARRATPFAMIEARGGLGKSKLAGALEARLCDAVATFRLDVGKDLLPRMQEGVAPVDALEAVVAGLAAVDVTSPDLAVLRRFLLHDEWVLLVDSLDEVSGRDRPRVIEALDAIGRRYDHTLRLAVFTRPPVYDDDYGLGHVHAWLSIEPLDCGATGERVRFALGEEDAGRFFDFAAARGLDARSQTREACRYVHLATYRDLFVATDVARDAGFDPSRGPVATRAGVYGAWIDGRARAAGQDPAAVREVLSRLVADGDPGSGTRSFSFSSARCAEQAGAAGVSGGAAFCEALAGSKLAKPANGGFRFDNQSVADYFLAAWADAALQGEGGAPDCARLDALTTGFESSEVAGFLLGLPNGAACGAEVVRALCRRGRPAEETFALVEQGLGGRASEVGQSLLTPGVGGDGAGATCVRELATRLAEPAGEVAR